MDYSPKQDKKLTSLRQINTTGSPLKDELYDWIRDNVKDVWINNGTGGTDICGVFVASCQMLPIHYGKFPFHRIRYSYFQLELFSFRIQELTFRVGELQVAALGMDLHAWNDEGKAVLNEEGNMVIKKPFPNLPLVS